MLPGPPRGLQGPPGASTASNALRRASKPQELFWGGFWVAPGLKALTRRFAGAGGRGPLEEAENLGASFGLGLLGLGYFLKGKINVHCIYLAHWGGWRQGCASRCTGRARRGSIRPLSIGSSHGCKG